MSTPGLEPGLVFGETQMISVRSLSFVAVLGLASAGYSQIALSAMTSFSGDGWLSPADYASYGTDDSRGMSLNVTTGNVYVCKNAEIRIINGTTGADLGTLNGTGISGGTRARNKVSVTADGQIFVCNLTTNSTTSPFKIYRYANELAAPELVFSGAAAGAAGIRLGDSFDADGVASSVDLIGGYGVGAGTLAAFSNGIARLQQVAPSGFTASSLLYTSAAAGAFRLGVAHTDANNFIGSAGGAINATRRQSFTDTSVSTPVTLTTNAERASDFLSLGGFEFLATIDSAGTTVGSSGNTVRVYQSTGSTATLIQSINLTSGILPNANASSDIRFGTFTGVVSGGYDGVLYALNTNNGIQAFNVHVVPEPTSMIALGLGAAALLRRRKK